MTPNTVALLGAAVVGPVAPDGSVSNLGETTIGTLESKATPHLFVFAIRRLG